MNLDEWARAQQGAAADVAQRIPSSFGSLLASTLGASAVVGGLCHAADRPIRWAAEVANLKPEKLMGKRSLFSSPGTIAILMAAALPAQGGPGNLLQNGDFELGNTGFSSDYTHTPAANTAESQYTIRTNPFPWNVNFVSVADHTDGQGNMFVGNGDSTAGSIVWESVSISVIPNTDYFFEAWAMNVCCIPGYTEPNSPAVLEFSVVGSVTESLGAIPTSFPAGDWQFLGTTWNSGSNTSVDLRIINQNIAIGGNDFALDDIHFSKETSAAPVPLFTQPFLFTLLVLLAGAGSLRLKLASSRPTPIRPPSVNR